MNKAAEPFYYSIYRIDSATKLYLDVEPVRYITLPDAKRIYRQMSVYAERVNCSLAEVRIDLFGVTKEVVSGTKQTGYMLGRRCNEDRVQITPIMTVAPDQLTQTGKIVRVYPALVIGIPKGPTVVDYNPCTYYAGNPFEVRLNQIRSEWGAVDEYIAVQPAMCDKPKYMPDAVTNADAYQVLWRTDFKDYSSTNPYVVLDTFYKECTKSDDVIYCICLEHIQRSMMYDEFSKIVTYFEERKRSVTVKTPMQPIEEFMDIYTSNFAPVGTKKRTNTINWLTRQALDEGYTQEEIASYFTRLTAKELADRVTVPEGRTEESKDSVPKGMFHFCVWTANRHGNPIVSDEVVSVDDITESTLEARVTEYASRRQANLEDIRISIFGLHDYVIAGSATKGFNSTRPENGHELYSSAITPAFDLAVQDPGLGKFKVVYTYPALILEGVLGTKRRIDHIYCVENPFIFNTFSQMLNIMDRYTPGLKRRSYAAIIPCMNDIIDMIKGTKFGYYQQLYKCEIEHNSEKLHLDEDLRYHKLIALYNKYSEYTSVPSGKIFEITRDRSIFDFIVADCKEKGIPANKYSVRDGSQGSAFEVMDVEISTGQQGTGMSSGIKAYPTGMAIEIVGEPTPSRPVKSLVSFMEQFGPITGPEGTMARASQIQYRTDRAIEAGYDPYEIKSYFDNLFITDAQAAIAEAKESVSKAESKLNSVLGMFSKAIGTMSPGDKNE